MGGKKGTEGADLRGLFRTNAVRADWLKPNSEKTGKPA
jgi:hypothetical protein